MVPAFKSARDFGVLASELVGVPSDALSRELAAFDSVDADSETAGLWRMRNTPPTIAAETASSTPVVMSVRDVFPGDDAGETADASPPPSSEAGLVGGSEWDVSPKSGAGMNKAVCSWQCGHSMFAPAPSAGNSMDAPQFWQGHLR